MIFSKKVKDKTGQRFGRLLVQEFSHLAKTSKNAVWKCLCDCGNTTFVSSTHLGKGTKSCGCLAKELSAKRIKEIHTKGKHLYFIRCNEYVKIGRADNVDQRLGQLKAANPYPIQLIKVIEDQGYREKEFHDKFFFQHIHGEWFQIGDHQILEKEQ